ncbi:hypothetical protein AA313_de0209673 [Arthrobotrys entomopaga]|nr:hypothetical protein AA313_de0209673 [Arthrobotrys entomopaga]
MSNPDPKTIPEANSPHFKNAQALEDEEASPVSPTFDNVPRRASNADPNFKWDMFNTERVDGGAGIEEVPMTQGDRRMSKEWDASKVPPSRFHKRAGSIHATPASRDGHVERNSRTALFDKLTKGSKGERRKSNS